MDERRKMIAAIPKFAATRETALDIPIKFGDVLGEKPGIELLNSMLMDPGISFPLHVLKLPISRSKLVYRNSDEDIQKFVDTELGELKRTLLQNALTALEHGFSAFEKRFELKGNMYHYKEFVHLRPEYIWVRIDPKTKGFNGLRQKYRGNEVELEPPKCYIFTYQHQFSNFYGKAQTQYAYVPWLLDKEFYRYHGLALQEFGLQTLLGRAPEGRRKVDMGEAEEQEIDNLEFVNLLCQSVHSRTSLALPSGDEWDIKPLFEKKQALWDFNKDHDFLDMKKALAILIPPDIWRSGGGGSYARAKVQSFWFEQTIGAIIDELTASIMRHIIKPIIQLNFWAGKEEPPYGTLIGETPSLRYHDFAEALIKDYEKKEKIDWTAIFKLMRLPLIEDTEETFGLEQMPTDIKTLRDVCRKAFNKGIEMGKEELAFTSFVPIPEDVSSVLKSEAHRLQFMLKQASSPESRMAVIGVVLARLRADGRVTAHEFFHRVVASGGYTQLNQSQDQVA